jgi:K(+)-stimulated pyrophosphate-energized sodium pump
LGRGVNLSSALTIVASSLVLRALDLPNFGGIGEPIVVGPLTGIVIGKATEYFTSQEYEPTKGISRHANTGPATVIVSGLGVGMISTVIPVMALVIGTTLANGFADGNGVFSPDFMAMGLYGIGIAAVDMPPPLTHPRDGGLRPHRRQRRRQCRNGEPRSRSPSSHRCARFRRHYHGRHR